MYKLDFTKDNQGVLESKPEDRYSVCYQAVTSSQTPAAFESWDDVISLLKKLKSIGREEKAENAPMKTFVLNNGGGVLELERSERTLLLEFIKKAPWTNSFLEHVRPTYNWIDKTPES